MSESDEDKSSKTEEPSERKLQKAREKGNVPKSREVNNFFMLLAIAISMTTSIPHLMEELLGLYGGLFSNAGTIHLEDSQAIGAIMFNVLKTIAIALAPTAILLMAFAYFGGFVQTGHIFSTEAILPKLSKISLIKGFGRMFSIKSVAEFLKTLVKMVVIGTVIYLIIYYHRREYLLLIEQDILNSVALTKLVVLQILIGVIFIAFLLAVFDFVFQRSQFRKEQMMTRREIKDEFKDTEGDPHIKSRQRQLRAERAKARMMQEVPNADVIITNPTHYAVALRYDKSKEEAPRVIAKGVDFMAAKIREVAKENKIPFYEDPPLARELYASVDIDEEIPLDLYEAVSKVVAYIYNLSPNKRKANQGG